MLRRLYNVIRVILYFLRVTSRTRSWTFVRLFWRNWRTPRRMPGVFRFPFGTMGYVDAESLLFMYSEIFIDQAYAVDGLPQSPRIIDCGGNIGLSVAWFIQRYPDAHVTVFEADHKLATLLAANVHVMCRKQHVEVVHAAVSDRSGTIAFASEGTLSGRIDLQSTETVPTVRLSDCITTSVDLLKIDIEGSEFTVIQDLCATGAIAHVQSLICEIHNDRDTQDRVGSLWSALSAAGFRLTLNRQIGEYTEKVDSTPFPAATSAAFSCILYAWRPKQSAACAHEWKCRPIEHGDHGDKDISELVVR